MKRKGACLWFLLLLLLSCQGSDVPERRAEKFLSAFLSCRFVDAAKMCSPEVVETMRWRASQLSCEEIALSEENVPDVVTEDVQVLSDDSCVVTCMVSDAFNLAISATRNTASY